MKEPTVLLVDDDRSLRESVLRSLRREPYRIIAVASGNECLDAISAAPIQVVVCDQQMPGIQGLDLLAHLRSSKPKIVRIMLSGKVTLDSAIDAVNDCEVFRLLSKPCPSAELALAIRAGLRQYELVSQSQRLLGLIQMQAAFIRNSTGGSVLDSKSADSGRESSHDLEVLISEATQEVESLESILRQRGN